MQAQVGKMGQCTTWKETCVKFKKYTDWRFWVNILEIYWDFCSVKIISLQEKKTVVGIISVAINDSSDVLCFDL